MCLETSFQSNSVDKYTSGKYDKDTIWNGFHIKLLEQNNENRLFEDVERILQYFLSRGGNKH